MNTLLTRLIPSHLQYDPDKYRQARLLSGTAVVCTVCALAYAVVYIWAGNTIQIWILLASSAAMTALIVYFASTGNVSVAGNGLIAVIYAVLLSVCATTGGTTLTGVSVLAWSAIFPLLGFFLLGSQAGWFWGIATAGACTVVFSLSILGYEFANYISQDVSDWLSYAHIMGLISCILCVSLLFESSRRQAAQALVEEKASVEAARDESENRRQAIDALVAKYLTFVEQVAQGNLTQRLEVRSNDTDAEDLEHLLPLYVLGENMNTMVDGLAEMASQNREMVSGLAATASEILAATTQQLSAATEQDASINQTTTTVDQVRATVQQTADRADSVAETSRRSVEIGERGTQAVQDSVEGMQLIRDRVEGIAENILALSEKTQQIGEIIASVNGIAEQSKMLALNASIEASRAGEEGKGFAVVAMEVRSLAEQSREATEQVRQILNEIQQATNAAVMATEEGSKGVDAGMVQVEQAGQVIDELEQVIRNAAQAATQIAASTRQQTTGMDQLSAAMDTIRQASVQSQSSTQQAERSAQGLSKMAEQLLAIVERYRL